MSAAEQLAQHAKHCEWAHFDRPVPHRWRWDGGLLCCGCYPAPGDPTTNTPEPPTLVWPQGLRPITAKERRERDAARQVEAS